jgi:site-specific DNA recombinase
VSRDNSAFSQRRAEPGAWLLRGLVRCGPCGVKCGCSGHRSRGEEGTSLRYYDCRYHSLAEAGGKDRQCRERRIRADALDTFVFDQVRDTLLRPDVLLAGQSEVTASRPAPDDELLTAELARLQRKLAAVEGERRRLVDLYQTGLVELVELQRRAKEIDGRRRQLDEGRANLEAERQELATDNRLRQRVENFAQRAHAALHSLDFDQRQQLLRLVVEDWRVTGWHVEIRLRIPLDDPSPDRPTPPNPLGRRRLKPASSNDRLRSLHL